MDGGYRQGKEGRHLFWGLGLFLVQLMVKYISLTSAFHHEVTSSGDREGLGRL